MIGDFEEFVIDKDSDLTLDVLHTFIEKHKSLVSDRYSPLYKMYIGKHDILYQDDKPLNKPDNRVVMNFAKYITDTLNGYFLGIPLKTSHDDEDFMSKLIDLKDFNNLDDEEFELSKDMSIFGLGYEMLYTDEEARVNVLHVSPFETFVIRDNSIRKNVRYGVHYYKDSEGVLTGSFSDDSSVYYFKESDRGLVITEEYPHYFGSCPIIEYRENEECQSCFESVYSLINQIDKVVSEKANDVDYFADAYLKVIGVELTDEEVRLLKDNRVWNLYKLSNESDGTVPDVDFISKPDADRTQENLLNRLEEKVYQLSQVPNLSDENFGTSSGIALAYKLQGLDNLCKAKERKFVAGLNKRYKILCNLPIYGDKEAYKDIKYTFTKNAPKNVLEEAQVVNSLNGLISKETNLSYLSMVDSPQEELERMKREDEYESGIEDDHEDEWSMRDVEGVLERERILQPTQIEKE